MGFLGFLFHTGDGVWDDVIGKHLVQHFCYLGWCIGIWDGVFGWGRSTSTKPEVKLEIVINRDGTYACLPIADHVLGLGGFNGYSMKI